MLPLSATELTEAATESPAHMGYIVSHDAAGSEATVELQGLSWGDMKWGENTLEINGRKIELSAARFVPFR